MDENTDVKSYPCCIHCPEWDDVPDDGMSAYRHSRPCHYCGQCDCHDGNES